MNPSSDVVDASRAVPPAREASFVAAHRRAARDAARAAATLLGAAALVAAAAFAVGEWRGWQLMRGPMAQALSRIAAAPVEIDGRFSLTLWPRPTVRAQVVRVAADATGLAAAPFGDAHGLRGLEAHDVTVVLNWSDLWQWQTGDADATLAVASVSAGTLSARWQGTRGAGIGMGTGLAPAVDRVGAIERRSAALFPEPGRDPAFDVPGLPVRIGRVDVGSATLAYSNREDGTALLLTAWTTAARVSNGQAAGVDVQLRGRLRGVPVDAGAHAGGTLPLWQDVAAPACAPVRFHAEGRVGGTRLTFDGDTQAWLGASQLTGRLRMAGASLADAGAALGLALPSRAAFAADASLKQRDGAWRFDAPVATLGRSVLAVRWQYEASTPRPVLRGRVAGPLLVAADLDAARGGFAPDGPATAAFGAANGRFALPGWRHLDVELDVDVAAVDFARAAAPPASPWRADATPASPTPPLATRIRIEHGVLTMPGHAPAREAGEARAASLI